MGTRRILKWKGRIAFALSLALIFTSFTDVWSGAAVMAAPAEEGRENVSPAGNLKAGEITLEGENVAWRATAAAPYSNGNCVPANVNNGHFATSDPLTSWNTWSQMGYDNPEISLEWQANHELTGMRVIWWADVSLVTPEDATANVTFPKSCRVEYLDDAGNWQQITGMVSEDSDNTEQVGVKYDSSVNGGVSGANKQWNTVKFPAKIKTKKLRLLIERYGTASNGIGISEWEVYGNVAEGEKTNIAREATVNASYAQNPANNVNNGKLAAKAGEAWTTWKNEGDVKYPCFIEMEWGRQRKMSSMQVLWWIDDLSPGDSMDGLVIPKSCVAQYWDETAVPDANGEKWVAITGMKDETNLTVDSVGVKFGSAEQAVLPNDANAENFKEARNLYWNKVTFNQEITAKKIRLLIDKPENASKHSGVGISEWEVYGSYENDPIVNGYNIARVAKASADYSNTDTSPNNVNDGKLGEGSKTSWNTWHNPSLEGAQPITLTWTEPRDITSMRVMWWADGTDPNTNGVRYPGNCEAWYYDHAINDWKQITDMRNESGEEVTSVGVSGNGTQGSNRVWNGVAFAEPVKTTQLQLRVSLPEGTGTQRGIGIGEWEVFSKKFTDEFIGANITGPETMEKYDIKQYQAESFPSGAKGDFSYEWEILEDSQDYLVIDGANNQKTVNIKALKNGDAGISLKMTSGSTVAVKTFKIKVATEGAEKFQVTFDANGGKVTPATAIFDDGSLIGELPVPTKTGSEFKGWYTEQTGGTEVTAEMRVEKEMTVYAHWEELDAVFGASGGQKDLGMNNVYLIAMTGDTSAEGNNVSAAYIPGETATGGNPLGSTRIGCLAFKLSEAWKDLDLDKISATVTINVAGINHQLGANKTRAGLFAVDRNLTDVDLTDAVTYPAKGDNYSRGATVFSNEWISAEELGAKTFDVTDIVKQLLEENATHAIFRLQTVTSGFLVSNSGENMPSLTVEEKYTVTFDANGGEEVSPVKKKKGENIGTLPTPERAGYEFKGWYTAAEGGEAVTEDTAVTENVTIYAHWEKTSKPENPNKETGSLTIACDGFTYDGTTKPEPRVTATTNEGAEVTYAYYADETCETEIESPVNAGTYYVKGAAKETDKYTQAVSEAVKFEIAPKKVETASVTGIVNQTYTGKELTQPGMKVEGYQEGVDYTVSYANNVDVGKATVTIVFQGDYTGTITAEFQIVQTQQSQTDPQNPQNPQTQQNPVPAKNKTYKSGNYQYKVTKSAAKGGTVEVKAPLKKTITSVSIPSTVKIDGYTFKVTAIGKDAFKNNKKLTKVTIGANVTKIGANAFSGCKKLKKITVKTKMLKAKSVGKNAFKNIHGKAVISVPKAKKKAYQKVFKGKGQKKTVKIK